MCQRYLQKLQLICLSVYILQWQGLFCPNDNFVVFDNPKKVKGIHPSLRDNNISFLYCFHSLNRSILIFCFYISEVQQVNQTDISYNDSTSPITDSVSYGPLKDSNYSGVSAVCVSVTQTQHLFIEYDSKVDDRTSSIRLSIIILGGFCIVMILLHVSLSVITWKDIKIEPVSIQMEERNYDYI